MQTDKPNFTEWTERPPFQLDDDNDEDDTLDRLQIFATIDVPKQDEFIYGEPVETMLVAPVPYT